jgi:hypothetical protein
LTGSIYPWQATCDSAVLEMDITQMPDRVTEALKAIDERLRSCIVYGEIEGARKGASGAEG